MKILQVIHSVDPRGGGPIEGVRQLIPALADEGIATEVLSLDAPGAPGTDDFPVPLHALGPACFSYGYTPRALPWLRENHGRYDAVLLHGLWQYGNLAVWRAVRGTSTPYFVYPHGMLDPWFKRRYPLKHLKKWLYWPWAEYRVLRDAAGVLFTCEQERLAARESFWLYRCQEQVTGFGIAPPPGETEHQRTFFLQTYPRLAGKRLIVFLGRIHEKKGCDLLLAAWKNVLSEALAGNFHLVLAGPGEKGYGLRMKQRASQLGLDATTTWLGMIRGDLKWGALRAADAFVLPSHQENFGVAVAEALACGVPVLISNQVNIYREIQAARSGLVENDDVDGTTHLLQKWFRLEPAERELMRAKAYPCFAQHFDMKRTAEALAILLREHKV